MAEPIETRSGLPQDGPEGRRGRRRPRDRPRHHRGLRSVGRIHRAERGRPERRGRAPPPRARPPRSAAARTGSVSVGSNHSDPGAEGRHGGDRRRVHDRDRHRRQAQHGRPRHVPGPDHARTSSGTPDTVYTWFSGFRMKFFADQGLNTAIDDVWAKVKDNYTDGFANVGRRQRRQGLRHPGRLLPVGGLLSQERLRGEGLHASRRRWDDLKALATKMQADGLTPIAFGDKDGWPAMGTFDILNLRLNGYDFHVGLMAGKEKWTDPKVTAVFQKWAEIVPFHAKDYAGLTWQNAAPTRSSRRSPACTCSACSSRRSSQATKDQADLDDLDFFPFPTLGHRSSTPRTRSTRRSTRCRSPPSRRTSRTSSTPPRRIWSSGRRARPRSLMFKNQPGLIPTANDADTSTYSAAPEEGRRRSSARPPRSPSSSTATPAPTSPGRTACRASSRRSSPNPNQDLAAYPEDHPGLLGLARRRSA